MYIIVLPSTVLTQKEFLQLNQLVLYKIKCVSNSTTQERPMENVWEYEENLLLKKKQPMVNATLGEKKNNFS